MNDNTDEDKQHDKSKDTTSTNNALNQLKQYREIMQKRMSQQVDIEANNNTKGSSNNGKYIYDDHIVDIDTKINNSNHQSIDSLHMTDHHDSVLVAPELI